MNTLMYKPEGMPTQSAESREYYYSPQALEKAAATGRILEGIVTLCDSELSLHVDLGTMKGKIRKEEALLSLSGEEVKDIAVITRVGKPVAFKIIGFEMADVVSVFFKTVDKFFSTATSQ